MNEELAFIEALLADPDDRTVLLVYADWLDEQNEPSKAAYLREIAAEKPSTRRLAKLRGGLDAHWADLVATRALRVGDQVEVIYASERGHVWRLVEVTPDRSGGKVQRLLGVGSYSIEVPLKAIKRIGP